MIENRVALLMVFGGNYLKYNDEVTAKNIQKEANQSNDFGSNPDLPSCRLALELLETGGFIEKVSDGVYCKKYIVKAEKEKEVTAEKIGLNSLQTPLWAGNI